jgi:hypothetical protein
MTGDEIVTITIENADKKISSRYSILEADRYKGTKGEYHLLHLDTLVEKFDSKNAQVEKYTYWNKS